MAKRQKYYVIWRGHSPGIYTDWASAKMQIDNFPNARYKSYESEAEATEAYAAGPPEYSAASRPKAVRTEAKPTRLSIAVDAACSGNPGVMEYRGVSLWDNKEIFRMKFDLGTNNIGEFLAIVHAMAMLQKKNRFDVQIYSDSQIAMGWIRGGKCKTKLMYTPRTAELFDLVKRAEEWLAANKQRPLVVKWPTDEWGEIPADFGRK